MSKGPGQLQQKILSALSQRQGDVHVNELCWELGAPPGTELTMDFYKSFRRAVTRLEDAALIVLAKRKLVTVDEVVEYYPSKTTTFDVKTLRERLLPTVKSYLDEKGCYQFGAAQTERHVLDKHPPSPELCEDWLSIEATLLKIAPQAQSTEDKGALVALLANGRWLVGKRRSPCPFGSFGQSVEEFCRTSLTARRQLLIVKLRSFYAKCVDPSEYRRAALKDRLYAVVNLGENQTPGLKDDFKKALLDREPDYIRTLPGHVDGSYSGWMISRERRFSEILDSLLSRDVFRSFEFARLA